jgi:hypothetical protein
MHLHLSRITRRNLRLSTGLVMFTYVTFHFIGHATGLWSIDAAEKVLGVAVCGCGTPARYRAAVFRRGDPHRARVPRGLRAAHAAHAAGAAAAHRARVRHADAADRPSRGDAHRGRGARLAPTYHRVIAGLWAVGGEGRQLALLAPGWLHGCLGLNFAFGHRRGWQRVQPLLLAIALLLPVLAGLGFVSMGRELAAMGMPAGSSSAAEARTATRTAAEDRTGVTRTEAEDRTAIDTVRRDAYGGPPRAHPAWTSRSCAAHMLDAWYALIALVLAARLVRTFIERRPSRARPHRVSAALGGSAARLVGARGEPRVLDPAHVDVRRQRALLDVPRAR